MKKLLFILLMAVSGLTLMAQNDNDRTPYLTRSLSAETIKDVMVRTSGGNIEVAASTSESRIEVYIRGSNGRKELSADEIKERLDEKYELTIDVANNKLTAIAKRKKESGNDWKQGLSISFKVFVTKDISTDLATSGGSITLSGVSGKQDFSTSGGSLNIDDVSGKIDGRTSGGSITISNSKDDIELKTSGGSIHAKDCTGKISLATSGGSLNFKNLDGNIKATTSGGSIHGKKINGELVTHTSGGSIQLDDLTCTLDASTSGGRIEVSVATLGKYIKLRNSGGSIDLELPEGKGLNLELRGDKVSTGRLENFSGTANNNKIEGVMNGGGVPVTAITGSGRVSVAFK